MTEQNGKQGEWVTTGAFVTGLWERFGDFQRRNVISDVWQYGRERGWLEEEDLLRGNREIERRTAARILHEFMRIEYHVPDERDWTEAKKLEDLYHCRACAKHVAQVYLRGIMQAESETRFGLLKKLSDEETDRIFGQLQKLILAHRFL